MVELKDLLSRFTNLLASGEIRAEAIIKAIHSSTGITIEKKDIKIQGQTVYLNIKPIYKNEIYLKKEQILFELEKSLGNKTPENFR